MFNVGDRVQLRPDVLQRHARSVPAHMGYTREQFAWRDTLRKLAGVTGVVSRIFYNCVTDSPTAKPEVLPQSKHVNVDFPDGTIGIDYTELLQVVNINNLYYPYDENTPFVIQVGRNKGSYKTRWSFPGKPGQAVRYYNAINIGNGYKKRLLVGTKVVAKVLS